MTDQNGHSDARIGQTLERLPHDRASCPGDSEVACIDGRIYEPCGEENCYGADVAGPDCDCVCHAIEEILPAPDIDRERKDVKINITETRRREPTLEESDE